MSRIQCKRCDYQPDMHDSLNGYCLICASDMTEQIEQLQAEIKRYKQALITIEARTIDIEPPYRAISANMMRDIAIKALKGE